MMYRIRQQIDVVWNGQVSRPGYEAEASLACSGRPIPAGCLLSITGRRMLDTAILCETPCSHSSGSSSDPLAPTSELSGIPWRHMGHSFGA